MLLPIVRTQWTSLYLLIFAFSGFILFLYGFFPLKYHGGFEASWDDLPNHVNDVRVDGRKLYLGNRTRVALMVIDALRFDFVNTKYMPFTANMINKGEACLYKARAEPPTVTMPRIKSTVMKRDKAQWRRTLNFWRDLFAMTTGSISNFIDVALNFGNTIVSEDSFLNQANINNKLLVFYGDDTWLRLFPETFRRSEGVTSFYVTDYTEVDLNVTKNLHKELSRTKMDWDLMILHYLGLDHIGHLEGPKSIKVLPKMLEMDKVIEMIVNASKKWEDDTVLIICGDHGMKDSGGHGGASINEVTVPLVMTQSKGCSPKLQQDVNQIDLAPTISYILGIPIPSASTGQILSQILSNGSSGDLSSERALYTLYYNAKINSEALLKILGEDEAKNKECYKRFLAGIKHHEEWLKSSKKNHNSMKMATSFYIDSMTNMAHYLTTSLVEFDMYAIILGITLILQTFIGLILIMIMIYNKSETFNDKPYNLYSYKKHAMISRVILIIFVIVACSFIFKVLCGVSQTNSAMCKMNPISVSAIISIIGIVVTNSVIIQNVRSNLPPLSEIGSFNFIECFLIIGTIIHPLMYGGTSFIEEEHQMWYFFWTSLTLLILAYTGRVLLEYYHKKKENATEVQDKESLSAKMDMTAKQLLPLWVFLMVVHRFLRTINQTGDKWAFLPDVSDWLNQEENYEILSLLSLASLCSTTIICQYNLKKAKVPYMAGCLLINCATICIFLYRVVTLAVQIPFVGHVSFNEIRLIQIFWFVIFLMILLEVVNTRLYFKIQIHKAITKMAKNKLENETVVFEESKVPIGNVRQRIDRSLEQAKNVMDSLNTGFVLTCKKTISLKIKILRTKMVVFLNVMMLICSLYLRPHNQLLVPCIYLTSKMVNKILDFKFDTKSYTSSENSSKNILCKTLFHVWIGSVFYFYQGNSNSLASVDLGSAYIGLESYMPIVVVLQMGIHTFTGPILAIILLFTNLVHQNRDWEIFTRYFRMCIATLVPLRVYSLLVYTIICASLRYHLFVWTVFSPKLVYEFMLTFFTILFYIIIAWFCKLVSYQETSYLIYLQKFYTKNASKNLHNT